MGVVVQHSERKCSAIRRMLEAPDERTGGCIDGGVDEGTDANVDMDISRALLI